MDTNLRLYMLVSEIGDDNLYPVRNTIYRTLEGAEKGRENYLKDGSKIPIYIARTELWGIVEEEEE